MLYFKKTLFVAALVLGTGTTVVAQPPFPPPIPFPQPAPSPVDGVWYFRGDLRKPCYVRTVNGPSGPVTLFTNENGTETPGWVSPNGREVTIPGWNLTGKVRGNAMIWPNGDSWRR